jgi:homoserine dehydrogenase
MKIKQINYSHNYSIVSEPSINRNNFNINSNRVVNIGLFGLGTVGSGIAEILIKKLKKDIGKRIGCNFNLKKIVVKDLSKKRDNLIHSSLITSNYNSIIEDPEIDVVIEAIGGVDKAKEIVLKALENGKNVITANKALIAVHGEELFKKAIENNKYLGYRGAITGAYTLFYIVERNQLINNKILSLEAVLNGTCNYILTKMEKDNIEMDKAVKEAQRLGYAEQDPSTDIDGRDTAHKLIILFNIAYNSPLRLKDITNIRGIRGITLKDILYAKEFGYRIKLMGRIEEKGKVSVQVNPVLIPYNSFLARLEGIYNGIKISDADGINPELSAPGAGKIPTASAIFDDLIQFASGNRPLPLMQNLVDKVELADGRETESEYYIRFMVEDKIGVLAKVTNILAGCGISIAVVIQKEEGDVVPVILMTHKTLENNLVKALNEIKRLDFVKEAPLYIQKHG